MATGPRSLTIRMYNVGFGDCFLLSFKYARFARHLLLDYGSTAAPKQGPKDYMLRIAKDIESVTAGKLDIVVATHRHQDHVSGFSTDAKTGGIIAALNPDHVIQPWTEDPRAKTDALTATASIYTKGRPDPQKMTAHFLGSLEDMHGVARAIAAASERRTLAGKTTREQLRFLGEDNIKNHSAVDNLMAMGRKGRAYYVNAGMTLPILPGVKCTVLGPPTLAQSNTIRKERARDADEFWQFRGFWASQSLAMRSSPSIGGRRLRRNAKDRHEPPPSVRWFLKQSQQIHVDQMMGLVRDLDSVMNNTSVILLLQIGKRKILLPGDAQIENWAYALSKPAWRTLLRDVNLYKVGHHGSLNATPRSLWELFTNKGAANKAGRIDTLCSTKSGKHGSVAAGTEVPRHTLVQELVKDSAFVSTETFRGTFFNDTVITF